ncbi:hybrid sensor histidine kinase/response regulator [Anabaena azotica]|uniref:histidine kinase n=1 Tax=Anabaena azotica FACHB-119 TaxID=947527 RepID=A0ABR8D8L5_9NOST|nr:PAS domain S-box protein [Anabaena azotica]MBD2503014.1 PAS domain S-box protein [Anabaena azotica FACHB-119]
MTYIQRSHLKCYSISIVSVLLALLLGIILEGSLKLEISPLLLACEIFSSWYGGLAPGIVATVLAIIVKDYFLIEPFNSLVVSQGNEVINLIVLCLLGLLFSLLNSQRLTVKQISEAKLAKLKVSYQHLLETAHEGIWIFDKQGKTEYVNPRLAQMLNYSIEQMGDRSIFDFIEPQPRQVIQQWLEQPHHQPTKQQWELRLQRQDQAPLWVIVSISYLVDQDHQFSTVLAVLTDITQRQQAQEIAPGQPKTDIERQRLQAILDILPVGVLISDPQGQLLEINPAVKAIWGEDAPLLDNINQYHEYKGWWADTGKPLASQDWTLARTLATGKAIIGEEIDIETFDGERKTILNSAIPIKDETGAIINAIAVNIDISHRKQVEAALRQSETIAKARAEELETIMETVPAAVWIAHDPQCHSMSVNRAAYEMMRMPPGSIMTATPASGEYPFLFKIQKNGQDIPLNELAMQQAGITGKEVEAEFEFVFSADDVRHIYGKAAPLRDTDGNVRGVIGAFLDITERQQLISQLQQSELMFRTLANTMPQMFWITHPDGYHEYFNQRWYDYTGKTSQQAQGEGWLNILHPDDVRSTITRWQNSLETGKDYETEFRLRRADGEYRWHLGRAMPLINQDGEIIKWFGSCTEIHDQKLAVEERAQAWERERAARIELEQANRMKDDFLAIVSHELRSPLNPILGWAKLLKSRKLDPIKTHQALEVIERNAKLQARLIDDLLDVSRILRGKLSLNVCTVDLVATIEAALETVRLTAEGKSIQIVTKLTDRSCKVEGDPNRLQQIVWNLLTNAVKFTPEGGRVEITLKTVDSLAQIEVSDTGKGISSDFLPYVFERFRQADEVTTRKFGGLGLGLAIVRHLVELHGGSVQVTSPGEGLGATFTVTLPIIVTSHLDEKHFFADITPNLQGLRMVVVDDDADTLQLLSLILEQYGIEVKAVSSAREALQAIAQTKPDILLSDIGMPDIDGYMLIKQIRDMEVASDTRLRAIALTAFAGETNFQKIMAAGFQQHLTKPVEPSELATVIANVMQNK